MNIIIPEEYFDKFESLFEIWNEELELLQKNIIIVVLTYRGLVQHSTAHDALVESAEDLAETISKIVNKIFSNLYSIFKDHYQKNIRDIVADLDLKMYWKIFFSYLLQAQKEFWKEIPNFVNKDWTREEVLAVIENNPELIIADDPQQSLFFRSRVMFKAMNWLDGKTKLQPDNTSAKIFVIFDLDFTLFYLDQDNKFVNDLAEYEHLRGVQFRFAFGIFNAYLINPKPIAEIFRMLLCQPDKYLVGFITTGLYGRDLLPQLAEAYDLDRNSFDKCMLINRAMYGGISESKVDKFKRYLNQKEISIDGAVLLDDDFNNVEQMALNGWSGVLATGLYTGTDPIEHSRIIISNDYIIKFREEIEAAQKIATCSFKRKLEH